ncbi:N-acetylglucosaminyl-phosphatidylinositol de-N-acetylase-like [Xenia sp. Carnegie-2017]|uniref:N-acetylglucosaminyl-phosphatidylinositol de-N-acetylase-like n=1 Tax=Xenia sp. Carnegie-2017 TaxID=2897299 RepID=UPI001F038E71|nr:N-acetylglucosaminyl-phosphatidylinositol de-N-acetylase-like [Xenia sp. Carnegie-2017]
MDRDGYSIWIFQQNVIIVAIYSCLFFFVVFFCYVSLKNRSWMEFSGKRVLLVIAHPDDECMFFGPVIYHACRAASSFSLLCLTKGNYYKKGDERKKELLQSCRILGIKSVTTLDNQNIVDNPNVMWNANVVSDILLQHIRTHNINLIITFDKYGVSGHRNHRSIYPGLKRLIEQKSIPYIVSVYTLDSVMLLRKYIFALDLIWSYFTRRLIYVSSLSHLLRCQKAMAAHKTQYVWFRKLYVIFSRYMIVNTLTQVYGFKRK